MASIIKIHSSTLAGARPTTSTAVGELAVNIPDKKLFCGIGDSALTELFSKTTTLDLSTDWVTGTTHTLTGVRVLNPAEMEVFFNGIRLVYKGSSPGVHQFSQAFASSNTTITLGLSKVSADTLVVKYVEDTA